MIARTAGLIIAHPLRLWLLLLCCLPWFVALPGVYLFDDYITPLNDPASQGLAAWWRNLGLTLRPLTKLSYGLEAVLGLDGADSRRLLQILMHGGNGLLFFAVLRRLWPEGERNRLPLLLAAGIVLLHPIQAEKVLAVAGRPTLLMEGLLLAAVLAALTQRYRFSLAFFFAAIMARETALSFLPLLLLLFASAPKPLRWLPAVPAVLGLILLLAIPRYRALIEFSFAARDLGASCLAQISALPVGLSLYLRPERLSIDHGELLAATWTEPLFLAGAACLLLLAALLLVDRPEVRGAACWMLGALVPTQSLIPKLDALTERPFALALPGVLVLLFALVQGRGRTWLRPGLTALMAISLPLLAVAAGQRALLYRDPGAIWHDAMVKSATNIRPHLNYATWLIDQDRVAEARAVLLAARAINPFDPDLAAKLRMIAYRQLLKENE